MRWQEAYPRTSLISANSHLDGFYNRGARVLAINAQARHMPVGDLSER